MLGLSYPWRESVLAKNEQNWWTWLGAKNIQQTNVEQNTELEQNQKNIENFCVRINQKIHRKLAKFHIFRELVFEKCLDSNTKSCHGK
jgi:hypothetical protein